MMTWKSTAVAGLATITATWLASYAPVGRQAAPPSATPSIERTETAAAEIQREADRLRSRIAQVESYRDPARNPFRFGSRRAAPARESRVDPTLTVEDLPDQSEPQPPTLRLTLAGIAEDTVADEVVRTAIISTPSDVLLVKVGDVVGGQFEVRSISADAVELTRVDTGTSVRLAFRP
jgi:hypothetical protein